MEGPIEFVSSSEKFFFIVAGGRKYFARLSDLKSPSVGLGDRVRFDVVAESEEWKQRLFDGYLRDEYVGSPRRPRPLVSSRRSDDKSKRRITTFVYHKQTRSICLILVRARSRVSQALRLYQFLLTVPRQPRGRFAGENPGLQCRVPAKRG